MGLENLGATRRFQRTDLAQVMIELQHDFAIVLLTNIGGVKADEALNALAPVLYAQFAVPQ